MAILAVSGGTGKLGRAIVQALKNKNSHFIYILARSTNDELSETLDVPIIPVDYFNVGSLTKALEENKIDTVISTVPMFDESATDSQLNLIEAAIKSKSTKRFIPSDFGIIYNEQQASVFSPFKGKLLVAEKLRSSGLEYTLVSNGFFMDYYGLPKVKSYLQPFVFAVDIANSTAAIPGSGKVPVVFTHTFDVAEYVAALIGEKKWNERSIIIGDKLTWNDLVSLAETTKGTKFDVTYDDEEKLKTFQVTELPSHPAVYPFFPKEELQHVLAVLGQCVEAGAFNLPDEVTLNKQFPDIKPLSMNELLQAAWKV
ncbi:NAD(P)-binding protein [Aspergillus transmontanensis]|uniref:NAD(P)-binding protein n=1 Tax=Aspergillus transmontanensis TaxID=1034304 RepID=A0A5N6VV67_9EURO|nr:NAD(P)-binding protein [Aspergillus transmontanensis]